MSLKVLLADDSMTAQNMAKKILADSGYEVTTVSNGAAAVKKIAELKPDLVILDIYMPGYSGLEVCERVRANAETARLPVLLTVGKMEPYRPEDGAKVRADGIIIKPFEATDLLALLKKFADKLSAPVAAVEELEETEALPEEVRQAEEQQWTVPKVEVPPEIAVTPAMFDVFSSDTPASPPASTLPSDWAPAENSAEPGTSTDSFPAIPQFEQDPTPYVPPAYPAFNAEPVSEEFESAAGIPLDMVEPEIGTGIGVESIEPPPEIEFTSAPPVSISETALESALEPTLTPQTAVETATDPALVTDPAGMMEFATGFGVAPALEESDAGEVNAHEVKEASAEPPALDDFEARVAAAMAAFEQPEPIEEAAPEQTIEEVAPTQETVSFAEATPEAEPVQQAPIIDETLILPTEAMLSLEEEMKKAMAEKQAAELAPIEPEPVPAEPSPVIDFNETMVLPSESLMSLEAEMKKLEEAKEIAPEPKPFFEEQPPAVGAEFEEPQVEQVLATTEPEDAGTGYSFSEAVPEPVIESEPESEPELEPQLESPLAEYVAPAVVAAPITEAVSAISGDKLASAIQRAIDSMKPQLIEAILKELKNE